MNEEKIWPGIAPGLIESGQVEKAQDSDDPRSRRRHISGVTVPTITVFPAPSHLANGMAVIVCPGGGWRVLSMDTEGYDVTRWLNSIGITAILLKYRLQPYGDIKDISPPLLDAQRTIRIVRSRAKKLNINIRRVGMIGFSAGGHISCMAATHWDQGNPKAADPLDRISSRPDFIMPIYTAVDDIIIGRINPDTPPAFIVTATDDFIAEHNLRLFNALRKIDVPAELHFFQKGGHGFGLGPQGDAVANWPLLGAAWLKEIIAPLSDFAPLNPVRPIPKEKGFHLRINCGTKRPYQDETGRIWVPDTDYASQGGFVHRGAIRIAGTKTPEIYRSERYGLDAMRIPMPNGTYTVTLHFAETFDGITKKGQRVFNVTLQGKPLLTAFDPFAEARCNRMKAVVKQADVTVKNKLLVIGFKPIKESPVINAVEIAPRR